VPSRARHYATRRSWRIVLRLTLRGGPAIDQPARDRQSRRDQQAGAVVAARTQIVAGAVGMVELALAELSQRGVIELDDERKAAMVSNLMVVLCSDTHTQPVVNTGTLYQ